MGNCVPMSHAKPLKIYSSITHSWLIATRPIVHLVSLNVTWLAACVGYHSFPKILYLITVVHIASVHRIRISWVKAKEPLGCLSKESVIQWPDFFLALVSSLGTMLLSLQTYRTFSWPLCTTNHTQFNWGRIFHEVLSQVVLTRDQTCNPGEENRRFNHAANATCFRPANSS